MKRVVCFVVLSIHLSFFSQAQGIRDTIYREGDLYQLLNNIAVDDLLQMERLAAYQFHQLINEYRASKGLKTVYWDDKLWIAARNHNVYLFQNNKILSHSQSKSKPYFTGSEPEIRIDYVTYGSREYEFGGFENCAVSGEMIPGSMDLAAAKETPWKEMITDAQDVAEEMFELWRKSSGHNSNMLNKEHLAHGTSFIFGEHGDYATTVFTQLQTNYEPDTLKFDFHLDWQTDLPVRYKENGHKYSSYPQGLSRIEYKLFRSYAGLFEKHGSIPDKKLYTLIKSSSKEESEQSLKKRYLKATRYLGIFKLMKYRINQQEYRSSFSYEDFYSLKQIGELERYFMQAPTLYQAAFWATSLEVENIGNNFTIIVKTYTLTPK